MARHAFSFAEVLFAILILGIGLIMVAGVFPVAAQQTISAADEAVASGLAREAINTIKTSTVPGDFVPGDNLTTFNNVWGKVSSSAIDASDARYAWVPFFTTTSDGTIRVSILVVRRRIHDRYLPTDTTGTTAALLARGVSISVSMQSDGNRRVDVFRSGTPDASQCVAQGTFLIINTGEYLGKVIRVGQFLSETTESVSYLLDPVGGLDPDDAADFTTTASIIGRDFKDASDPDSGYDGPAQDISVFTTFLSPS